MGSTPVTLTTTSANYGNAQFTPGTYTITIEGTVQGARGIKTVRTSTTSLTIIDPCAANLVSISTTPTMVSKIFTITDPAQTLTLASDFSAKYTASNAICETQLLLTTDDAALTAKLVLDASAQSITIPLIEDSLALA